MWASFCPHQVVRRVEEVDLEDLKARGIRALLLDLDNTLTPWLGYEMTPAAQQWLAQARRDFQVCLVSNQVRARRVRRVAEQLGIVCVHGLGPWGKPWSRIFRRALRLTGAAPEQAAMIGDQLFTDVWGARRMGMYAILVEPVGKRELAWTRLHRWLARWVEKALRRRGLWPQERAPGEAATSREKPVR